MELAYLHDGELGAQDCPAERCVFSDGEIVVSVNPFRAEAPVFWRWLDTDEQDHWRDLPLQTADLPLTDEQRVEFVRLHADVDDGGLMAEAGAPSSGAYCWR